MQVSTHEHTSSSGASMLPADLDHLRTTEKLLALLAPSAGDGGRRRKYRESQQVGGLHLGPECISMTQEPSEKESIEDLPTSYEPSENSSTIAEVSDSPQEEDAAQILRKSGNQLHNVKLACSEPQSLHCASSQASDAFEQSELKAKRTKPRTQSLLYEKSNMRCQSYLPAHEEVSGRPVYRIWGRECYVLYTCVVLYAIYFFEPRKNWRCLVSTIIYCVAACYAIEWSLNHGGKRAGRKEMDA